MRYGIYTHDLKGVSLTGRSLEECRRYRHGDRVICSEKEKTYGFKVSISITSYWSFRVRPRHCYANLGFVHIEWMRLRFWTHDTIVEDENGPRT